MVQHPLPRALAGGPAETGVFQLGADVGVGLPVKQDLNAVFLLVHNHPAAIEGPALRGGGTLFRLQLRDPGLDAADRLIVIAQKVA